MIPLILDAAMLSDVDVKVDVLKVVYELLVGGESVDILEANLLSLLEVLLHCCLLGDHSIRPRETQRSTAAIRNGKSRVAVSQVSFDFTSSSLLCRISI